MIYNKTKDKKYGEVKNKSNMDVTQWKGVGKGKGGGGKDISYLLYIVLLIIGWREKCPYKHNSGSSARLSSLLFCSNVCSNDINC